MVMSDNHGVGHFRSIDPAKAIEKYYNDEFSVEINQHPNLEDIEYLKKFDIIHFHRGLGPKEHEDINFARIRSLGIKIVADIDDYWEPFFGHPMYLLIKQEKFPEKILDTLKKVDYVTTTTELFAEEIRKYNPNVYVIPNAINREDKMWKHNDTRIEGDQRCRISWIGGSCYDDQTEILTENGFKLFKDLVKNEKVACLNPETNNLEYHIPKNYLKEHFVGDLNRGKNNLIDYAVTPNHKMYVSEVSDLSKKELNFKLIPSEEVYNKNLHFKKTSGWIGIDNNQFTIPALYNEIDEDYEDSEVVVKNIRLQKYTKDKIVNMNDWLKFFGFWIAEGWTTQTEGLNQVGITQIKDNGFLEEMFITLKSMGYNPTLTKDKKQLRVFDKQLWTYLSQFGKAEDKFIPKELLNLPIEKLKIFLDWFLKGDGHQESDSFRFDKRYNEIRSFKTSRKRGYTVSKKLADNIQEICLKLGIISTITNRGLKKSIMKDGRKVIGKHDAYVISIDADDIRSRKNPLLKSEDHFKESYNGFVYCVEVPHNIIFVRRNGKTIWCGNSHLKDLQLMENSFNLLHNNEELKNKYQVILSGFDVRGILTSIDENGHQTQTKMKPQQSVWYAFEKILSANYQGIKDDVEYTKWLQNYQSGEYPNVLTKNYVRRNTLPLTKYAIHYDYCDVALAPLDIIDQVKKPNGQIINQPNIFNKVKSELKIIEAGMKKKALIAQDFGIYKELLKNEETALLVNKNEKGWYQAIRRLILEPELREKLAENLHNFVKDKYDIKNVTKERINIYKEILSKTNFILKPI